MALFNYATKEITIKVVYYGPGLSGKTTNLQYLHSRLNPNRRGKLLSLATEADRTLFFDLLPVDMGKIRDFSLRFQLYTVPGQVRYNATRRLVLKGADAVIFVADSQHEMQEQNLESFKNMRENLIANNINPDDIPLVLQYNKRDLPNILSIDELNKDLNENGKYEYIESVAIDGTGVEESFQRITNLAIEDVEKRQSTKLQPIEEIVEATTEIETAPIIESTMYTYPDREQSIYKPLDIKKNNIQTATEKEVPLPREVIVKEVREIPVIPEEKLDQITSSLNEIVHNLTEIKNILKDTKKEQKETNVLLRDMRNYFDKMKAKKSWFRF